MRTTLVISDLRMRGPNGLQLLKNKFFLDVDKKYDFLLNDKNREKTDGFLVVEFVPKDQDIAGVYLPKSGDQVHIWGAWVTDKPKGWHEIHPAWKVANE